jgi:metal-sulfur cluster biosynthetic enzyme
MTDTAVVDRVLDALRTVYDPELGLDIVSLGLIYDVREVDGEITVEMTLTTPGCPVSDSLPREAAAALSAALHDYRLRINTVWDPPWSPELMSEEALRQLGFVR